MAQLFVGQLPFNRFFPEDLVALFSPFGTVLQHELYIRKGSGFVTFATTAEADRAIQTLHGKVRLRNRSQALQVMYSKGTRIISAFGVEHQMHCSMDRAEKASAHVTAPQQRQPPPEEEKEKEKEREEGSGAPPQRLRARDLVPSPVAMRTAIPTEPHATCFEASNRSSLTVDCVNEHMGNSRTAFIDPSYGSRSGSILDPSSLSPGFSSVTARVLTPTTLVRGEQQPLMHGATGTAASESGGLFSLGHDGTRQGQLASSGQSGESTETDDGSYPISHWYYQRQQQQQQQYAATAAAATDSSSPPFPITFAINYGDARGSPYVNSTPSQSRPQALYCPPGSGGGSHLESRNTFLYNAVVPPPQQQQQHHQGFILIQLLPTAPTLEHSANPGNSASPATSFFSHHSRQ